jgi:formylglycine-generating enzyme required for sulfatase activity
MFMAASRSAETNDLAKANAAQRRIIRMQAMTSVLLGGVVILLIGWINQSFIKDQWRLYTVSNPFRNAKIDPYVLSSEAEQKLKPKDSFKECAADAGADLCPEMVVLPAGSFLMGSPKGQGEDDEYPQHQVTIVRPLAVAKYELTFAEWDTCAAYGDCDPNIDDSGWGRGRQPVINDTWNDASRYVRWLSQMTRKSYRLLSEAEWEYAARAGTQTTYPWGNQIGKGNAVCVGCGSKWDGKQPAPVGSLAPNAFGLYDMAGNLREWVEDCYQQSYSGAPKDGSAWTPDPCHYRDVRDGSWGYPELPRSAAR